MRRYLFCLLTVLSLIDTTSFCEDTPLSEQLEKEAKAIKALSGVASNIQKNRDGTVRFVRFSKPIVSNEHLRQISVFSHIDFLSVVIPQVTDTGLEEIFSLKNLEVIDLSYSGITDQSARIFSRASFL